MATKKCPKCGEENPAEAVMCWACYTPLTAGAGAAVATPGAAPGATLPAAKGAPVGVPPGAEEEAPAKKNVDPKLIGIGAFLVLGGLAAFFLNSGGSSTTPTDPGTGGDPTATPASNGGPGALPTFAPNTNPDPPVEPVAFTVIAPANPEFKTGTMGVLITKAGVSAQQAASYGRFARQQAAQNGHFSEMQVCVFTDRVIANSFMSFQMKRRGAKLTPTEYQQLAANGVWSGTPAFIEFSGKRERVLYPSRNPNGWWTQSR